VRWAHSGRWIASGSDDEIVMIWDLDPCVSFGATAMHCTLIFILSVWLRTAKGKVWGSDEVNVEGWKPMKRLSGHDSGESCVSRLRRPSSPCPLVKLDVTDIAWSPGDRYLATVGLDSQVLIWCGFTLGAFHFFYSDLDAVHPEWLG